MTHSFISCGYSLVLPFIFPHYFPPLLYYVRHFTSACWFLFRSFKKSRGSLPIPKTLSLSLRRQFTQKMKIMSVHKTAKLQQGHTQLFTVNNTVISVGFSECFTEFLNLAYKSYELLLLYFHGSFLSSLELDSLNHYSLYKNTRYRTLFKIWKKGKHELSV